MEHNWININHERTFDEYQYKYWTYYRCKTCSLEMAACLITKYHVYSSRFYKGGNVYNEDTNKEYTPPNCSEHIMMKALE